jgi:preprotein translocase subunit SecF
MEANMWQLIPPGSHFDFIGKAKPCIALSLLVILIGIGSIVYRGGLNQGIDFRGGTLVQLRFSQPAVLSTVREVLEPLGLDKGIVQHFGDEREVLIRIAQLPEADQDIGKQVQKAFQSRFPEQTVELRRIDVVGPQVSTDLRRQALFALFYAILGIVIYLSGRFEAKWFIALALAVALFAVTYSISYLWPGVSPTVLIVVALGGTLAFCLLLQLRYALAAIAALFHDVLVTVGFFSLFDKEFDLSIVAALLTIIGYSLNDTIVIFDRVRENMQGQRHADFATVVNASVNQTLSRTILTTATTLMVVVPLFFFGGQVIHDFAFALLVGMIAGVYSTIFIASPILVYWQQYMLRPQTRSRRVASSH